MNYVNNKYSEARSGKKVEKEKNNKKEIEQWSSKKLNKINLKAKIRRTKT